MSISIIDYSFTGDCSNTSIGAVTFNVTGTTPPFAVTCLNSSLPPSSALTAPFYSYEATGLSGDTYFLQIIDGASNTRLQSIYISSGTSASIDSTNTTCGFDNGSVTGFTSGVYGYASFAIYDGSDNYITSASTPNNFYEFQGISANTYYIVADDGGGCTGITPSVVINQSDVFDFGGYVVNDGSCLGGPSGKIFLTGLTLPTSAYTISWLTNVNSQTGTTVTGLTSGSYNVQITNPDGCETTKSFTINSVGDLTSAGFIVIEQPNCFDSNGEVEFIITGGTPPYFFSASTGQVEITFGQVAVFSGLSSGAYNFLVTDAGLCTIYDSVNVGTPNSFTTVQVNTTPSTCSTNDGTIYVIVDNGVTTNPTLTISISGSSGTQYFGTMGQTSKTFFGLSNGTYIVKVESVGCTYTAQTIISSVNLYNVTSSVTGTTCGIANGMLEVLISSGGTIPYTYTLKGPEYNPKTIVSPIGTFNNLEYGNYTLTIQDSTSPICIHNSPIFINYSESVFFNLMTVQPFDRDDGSISSYVTKGTPPFTYEWGGIGISGQTGSTLTGLPAGTYSLTITDSNECFTTKNVQLFGTKKLNNYRYFNICQNKFRNSNTIGYRNVKSMYLEGFNDLTSGDTNCIVNESIFSIYTEVGGQSAQTSFYTGVTINDYPSDTLWSQTIIDTLNSFVGISEVTVDVINNRITIKTTCEKIKKGCTTQTINPLQDTSVIVSLIIDYDISCEFCSPTPTPTTTLTLTPTPTTTLTPTPTLTPTESQTIFTWVSGANWYGDSGTACLNYNSFAIQWSLPTITPTISTFLVYIPTGLPITGEANNWIAISPSSSPGSIIYAVQVDVYGEIINVILCP